MGLVELVVGEEEVDPCGVLVVVGTWLSRHDRDLVVGKSLTRRDPLYAQSEPDHLAHVRDLVDKWVDKWVSVAHRVVGQMVVVEVVVVKLMDPVAPVVPSDLLAFVLVLSQIPLLLPA